MKILNVLCLATLVLFGCVAPRHYVARPTMTQSFSPDQTAAQYMPHCTVTERSHEAEQHLVSIQFVAHSGMVYQVGLSQSEGNAPQSDRYCFQSSSSGITTVYFYLPWVPQGLLLQALLPYDGGRRWGRDPALLETPTEIRVDGRVAEVYESCYEHSRLQMGVCEFRFYPTSEE